MKKEYNDENVVWGIWITNDDVSISIKLAYKVVSSPKYGIAQLNSQFTIEKMTYLDYNLRLTIQITWETSLETATWFFQEKF